MDDSKTYVFSDPKTSGLSSSDLLALMNNNGGFGGNGNWMWIIFLFFLYGWGGNGMFGRGNLGGLGNEINNDYGRSLLLQAINGNGTAISQLATTLNCDVNAIQTAINSVQSSVSSVGNQVGMSGMQVINAIQSGNQTIASQLAQCCCDNKLLITSQGYENRISTAEQTSLLGSKIDGNSNAITSAIASQTTFLSDKFCDLEKRELQNKIDALRESKSSLEAQISNAQQTAQIQSYVASLVSPLATEVASIKCKLPETVTLPYSCATAVPTILASQYYNGYLGTPNIWS